jgi:hypothetical protein
MLGFLAPKGDENLLVVEEMMSLSCAPKIYHYFGGVWRKL